MTQAKRWPDWTQEEDAIIREHYPRGGARTVASLLWKAIIAWFGNRCAYCGIECERLTQDHVVPISRGGTHDAKNVVPACRHCNARKYARTPEQAGMPIRWPEGELVLETK